MAKYKLSVIIVVLAITTVSCSDINNTLITRHNVETISQRVVNSKLDQDDVSCFLEAMRRAEKNPELQGTHELINYTVRSVIDNERKLQEEEAKKKERVDEFNDLIESMNNEAEILFGSGQHFLREVVWVDLKAIKRIDCFFEYEYKAVLELSTGAPNFSVLSGVKGEAIYCNAFGEELLRMPFEYTGAIYPNKPETLIVDLPLNNDIGYKIYSDVSNIVFDFYLTHVVYADGTINKQLSPEESRIEVLELHESELQEYSDFDLPSDWILALQKLREKRLVI